MKLEGKVAIVTGGGRGIGKAICLAFAREGSDLVIASDVESEVIEVARQVNEMNRKGYPYKLDITRPEEVEAMVEHTMKTAGKVDILVNNAGVVGKRFFIFESDDEIWRRTIEVNLIGTYYVIKAFLPKIIEQKRGRIINIASISGKQASPTNSAYSASKHGVIGLTRTVASEMCLLGLPDITVNAICPGVTNTEMITGPGGVLDELSHLTQTPPEVILEDRLKPMALQNRMLEPEEIADMATFLASDSAKGITGQAINVCGGAVFH